jgi:hypothetical protein
MRVLAGSDDEVFDSRQYATEFDTAGARVPVTLVPGVGHIGLTLDARAIAAIIDAVR